MNNKTNKKQEFKNICLNCKSENVIKWTKRKTQNRGLIQRYKCKDCQKTFTIDDGFFRMRNHPKKITCALDLFYRGLSTRDVQNHFKAFFPHNSDHSTILRWVRKFISKITNFTDNLKIETGSYMEVDEMQYQRRKSHKKGSKGTDENWLINAIDVKHRFLVSSSYVKSRGKTEIKNVLTKVKSKTGTQVKIITTDGLTTYTNAVKKTFGYNNKTGKYKIKHRVVTASKGEGFNIWIERLHNTIRQRTQNFRGLHGSLKSANSIMKGLQIYYNFVKKHEALKGKTPSDLAIPELKFKTHNRWLELIELATIRTY